MPQLGQYRSAGWHVGLHLFYYDIKGTAIHAICKTLSLHVDWHVERYTCRPIARVSWDLLYDPFVHRQSWWRKSQNISWPKSRYIADTVNCTRKYRRNTRAHSANERGRGGRWQYNDYNQDRYRFTGVSQSDVWIHRSKSINRLRWGSLCSHVV